MSSVFTSRSFAPYPFPHRVSDEPELCALRRTADMREPQEVERFRLPESTLPAVAGRKAAELDEASLVLVQLERELCESLAKIAPEALGLSPMLEPNHDVGRSRRSGVNRELDEPDGSSLRRTLRLQLRA